MTEVLKGRLIQFFQGARADLPILKVGEPAFCTDDFTFWIGSSEGNKQVAMGSGGGSGGSSEITNGSVTFEKLSTQLQNQINEFITINDIPVVTNASNGLMTSFLFNKLSAIEDGATNTVVVDNLATDNSLQSLSARQGKLINDRLTLIEGNGGGSGTGLIPATATVLGGIKVGNHLNVAVDGKLDVKEANTNTVGVVRLEDSLITTYTDRALTASQGKIINDKVSNHEVSIADHEVRISKLENSVVDYTVSVPNSWVGTVAPYTQTLSINGILASDNPIAFPIYSLDNDVAISEQESWSLIGKITTSTNSITITCFRDKPYVPLTLQLKVVR